MIPDCFIIWALKEEPHMDQGETSERTIGFEQNPYFATFLIHSCSTEIGNKSSSPRKQHQLKNPRMLLNKRVTEQKNKRRNETRLNDKGRHFNEICCKILDSKTADGHFL